MHMQAFVFARILNVLYIQKCISKLHFTLILNGVIVQNFLNESFYLMKDDTVLLKWQLLIVQLSSDIIELLPVCVPHFACLNILNVWHIEKRLAFVRKIWCGQNLRKKRYISTTPLFSQSHSGTSEQNFGTSDTRNCVCSK